MKIPKVEIILVPRLWIRNPIIKVIDKKKIIEYIKM